MNYRHLYQAILAGLVLLGACAPSEKGGDALIAVATNFAEVAAKIETDFEAATSYEVTLSTGATGQLYAQILNGAPYDVFLSADQARPRKLEEDGQAVLGSRFTYARGAIGLWSPTLNPVNVRTLEQGNFRRLAIANPDLAPYGRAAQQFLESENLYETLSPKIVMGENIGQTVGLIATGNADLGFIALSAISHERISGDGIIWVPDESRYDPIFQDAVLLTRAKENEAAKAFLDYMKSYEVETLLSVSGYREP